MMATIKDALPTVKESYEDDKARIGVIDNFLNEKKCYEGNFSH